VNQSRENKIDVLISVNHQVVVVVVSYVHFKNEDGVPPEKRCGRGQWNQANRSERNAAEPFLYCDKWIWIKI
jgi:hypothetical protein